MPCRGPLPPPGCFTGKPKPPAPVPTCSPPLRAAAGRLPHRFALAQGAAHGAARRAAPGAARSRPLPCGAPWRPRPPLPLGRHGDGRGRGRKPSAGAGATPRGSRRAWGGAGRPVAPGPAGGGGEGADPPGGAGAEPPGGAAGEAGGRRLPAPSAERGCRLGDAGVAEALGRCFRNKCSHN